MTNELTDVRCPCGAEFQADSYDAGFIAGSGMCQNCDAAMPPKDIPAPAEQAEAERPEVAEVAFVLRNIGAMDAEDIDGDNVDLRFEDAEGRDTGCDVSIVEYAEKAADLFEQHERIVGELRAENAKLSEALDECDGDRWKLRSERDAALARVSGLRSLLNQFFVMSKTTLKGCAATVTSRTTKKSMTWQFLSQWSA